MDFAPFLLSICALGGIFSIPLSIIWTRHHRKMLEIQLQLKQANENRSGASLEALREEIRTLRDTTLQYDMSFDAALQRMEQRVGAIERNGLSAAESQERYLGG